MSELLSSTGLRRSMLALAGAALFVGCVPTLPNGAARRVRTNTPRNFGVGGEAGGRNSASLDWHGFFNDPYLTALIDQALQNNQELNINVQEMIIANNEVMARRGEYLPTLGFSAGAGLERVGRYTSQGQADEHNGVAPNLQSYSFGLYSAWEVDIWGRLRNAADAAMYRYLASQEARNFVITRLVAEIASRYYDLLALDRQLLIVRTNIELQQNSLEMVRIQQQAARVTMLAVQRFEAQLRGFQSRQFEIQQHIVEAENQINFLLGRFPQHVERTTVDFLTIVPPTVNIGTPQQLLENRPDVRQAERQLRAAALDVSSARAAFYPSLRLDAGIGYQSFDITRLVNTPDSILYSIFAGVMAPLLNRAGITATYFSANSRQMQAVVNYERAILTAYLDVNSGLNLLRNLAQTAAFKIQQVDRLAQAVDTSTLLFNSARADYLEVLTTRRDFLEAQMELIETKQRQLTATVALYQAIGGGWRQPERNDRGARGNAPARPVNRPAPPAANTPATASGSPAPSSAPPATNASSSPSPVSSATPAPSTSTGAAR